MAEQSAHRDKSKACIPISASRSSQSSGSPPCTDVESPRPPSAYRNLTGGYNLSRARNSLTRAHDSRCQRARCTTEVQSAPHLPTPGQLEAADSPRRKTGSGAKPVRKLFSRLYSRESSACCSCLSLAVTTSSHRSHEVRHPMPISDKLIVRATGETVDCRISSCLCTTMCVMV